LALLAEIGHSNGPLTQGNCNDLTVSLLFTIILTFSATIKFCSKLYVSLPLANHVNRNWQWYWEDRTELNTGLATQRRATEKKDPKYKKTSMQE